MNLDDWRPSTYLVAFRRSFRDLIKPGRPVSDESVAHLTAQLNSGIELTRELEDESLLIEQELRQRPLPQREPSPIGENVVQFRPRKRLVVVPPGGGDAA